MAARRPDDAGTPASLDGRLDLDALDVGHDPMLDLDVIGEDRPTARETVVAWLEPTGLLPVLARHRKAFVASAVVAALLLATGGIWWIRRPAALRDPHVFARAAGADPTAALVTDPSTGMYVGVQQKVLVSSAEPQGVALRLLGITGPGLAIDPAAATPVDLQRTDRPLVLGAALACTSPEATTAALASGTGDYAMLLQRTAPEGEVRVDRVPLVGSVTLVDLVHKGCLQIAADRDLLVRGISAAPVAGLVALKLDVALDNPSPRSWSGLHVAAAAQPVITNDGRSVQLEPSASGHLQALYWPTDCSDPVGPLRDGIAIQADLGPDGLPPAQGSSSPSVLLRLPGQMLDDVASVAQSVCGTDAPRSSLRQVRLREGGGGGSAGTIDLLVDVTTPGAFLAEIDHPGDGGGELITYESPVHPVDGVATIKARWVLPSCQRVIADGLPRLHVVLVGDVKRPYLVPLRGEALRPVLYRLCGDEVAALAG